MSIDFAQHAAIDAMIFECEASDLRCELQGSYDAILALKAHQHNLAIWQFNFSTIELFNAGLIGMLEVAEALNIISRLRAAVERDTKNFRKRYGANPKRVPPLDAAPCLKTLIETGRLKTALVNSRPRRRRSATG